MEKTINICRNASIASTEFERTNTELKRQYLIYIIELYKEIVSQVNTNQGSFGTGYPFYALNQDLTGQLPIIDEQIRYNDDLLYSIEKCGYEEWPCASCLSENYDKMPDLKGKCKPCPNLDDSLKPRKILNRLPDIDLWTVCEDGKIDETKERLNELFRQYDMKPSDIDPVQTISEIIQITHDIKNGIMPTLTLPLDSHIVEYSTLYSLIEQTPYVLQESIEQGTIPYLPIHPLSLRKQWQHDDTPYNFIHDYLYSLTDYNFKGDLKDLLIATRKQVASSYSTDELFKQATISGNDAVARRNKTRALRPYFNERINSWK